MTHILLASTGLTEQPLAINGRTAFIPTNKLVPLAPIAASLGSTEPDDVVAALIDSRVEFERIQQTETLGAALPAGDLGGGAVPGGSAAPPDLPVDMIAHGDGEGLTLAQQGITGPANELPPVPIMGETDPLQPPETFPADPPAPPAAVEPDPEPSLLDQSIQALTAALEGVDSVELIDALIADETGGKTRTGALAALEARKAALTEQQS